ncbi:MAG: rhomboid family intramembrane serine protease [Actinobacteria bacterium]|nr:MAG: rhomboid family intramembrane serine protease [Actinomycetota bacterium]
METCYRHPNRETGVHCSNCGRPICPDCMTPTPVGMRCPECSSQRTRVRTLRSTTSEPMVTYVLIALNMIVFLAEGQFGVGSASGGTRLFDKFALDGPDVANGDYWRIVSSGFLHAGLLHIFFNMYLLYLIGRMLEPAIGSVRFALVYAVSLFAGALGALIVTPDALTVGASGAVFGLMGAAAVEMSARGINPMETGIGPLIIFNLLFSFVFSGISVGGHIGGLIGGAVTGFLFLQADKRRIPRQAALGLTVALGALVFAAAVYVA